MTTTNKTLIGAAATLLIGLGAAGTAIGAGQATASNGPLGCSIETSRSGGMIAIESVAKSASATTGSYTFSVRGPGTNISQGGDFEAGAGETVTLGQVMLGGGSYDLKLEVSAGGHTVSCSERLGSI
jgi:hypothetical protein